ncbi:hypothetical protein PMAYCL1PPCAC_05257, partial [Pristionchus mayeri]
ACTKKMTSWTNSSLILRSALTYAIVHIESIKQLHIKILPNYSRMRPLNSCVSRTWVNYKPDGDELNRNFQDCSISEFDFSCV